MLNKKAGLDDWLPLVIAIIFITFLLFFLGFLGGLRASAAEAAVSESAIRKENSEILLNYLRTAVDENSVTDLIELVRVSDKGEYYEDILEKKTKDMFNEIYGKDNWQIEIKYPSSWFTDNELIYQESTAMLGISATKTYTTKILIPTSEKTTTEVLLRTAAK